MATIIYNCKRCKFGRRVEYAIQSIPGYFYRETSDGKRVSAGIWITSCGGGKPTVYDGDIEFGLCPNCRRAMNYGRLTAVLNAEHKCDARCTGARGSDCECSCGGVNHGKAWAA